MNGLFKKTVAGVMTLALAGTMAVAANAQNEMSNMLPAGYDLTNPYNPNKIYNEVIDGKYTGKQILVPVTPVWKAEGYEAVYPYAGVSRMYLEGKKQNVTAYNNLFPQWEARRHDYLWEMAYPYTIYERHQTKVDNKTWTWDFGNDKFNIPDSALLTPTDRTANVLDITWKPYGFGRYNLDGTVISAAQSRMYNYFGITAETVWNNLVANTFTTANLSARDANGAYVMTDAAIAALIPAVQSKFITAKFNHYDNEGYAVKDIAKEWLIHELDFWAWDADSLIPGGDVKVEWTAPAYELDEPYAMYQFMIVNGVVMDGTKDRNNVAKDLICRYTGGYATPNVTWKFKCFQAVPGNNAIFEVVEEKYVDGIATGITRIPTGEYAKTYFKVVGNDVEFRAVDKAGHDLLIKLFPNFAGNLGGLIAAFNSATDFVSANVAQEAPIDIIVTFVHY